MPWNPNVPTVTNRVQDDLDAIRENFQHLDLLAERVDELQTVSELAPFANDLQTVSGLASVAGELQTVSGLASVAGELQTVSGLASVAGELQTVSELAPYVQAILDSRIVEMGSNSNGTYVRWENGLQVVFGEATLGSISLSAHPVTGSVYASPDLTVTLPAAFSTDVYAWHVNADSGLGFTWVGLGSLAQSQAGSITFRLYGGSALSHPNVRVSFFAIGRWK